MNNTLVNRILALVAATVLVLGSAATAHAEGLTTHDYVEIEQLYATYNHAIDSGDAEAWAATFTPDGTFNRFAGHDQLVGFIDQWKEKMNGANRRHWNTNLRILPSKDGATASVYLLLLDVSTKPAGIVATGMYNDTLVKTPNGWRFKSRQTKMDAPAAAAAAPSQKP